MNPYYGLLAIMVVMAGGGVGWLAFRNRGAGYTQRGKKKKYLANSFNIYENRLAFEQIENASGQLRLCRNDGQYYYVHIESLEKKHLVPFMLPDAQYRDPREFANNVNIPCHRRLARGTTSLLQKLAPFAIVAGMGIMAFLLLTLEKKGG